MEAAVTSDRCGDVGMIHFPESLLRSEGGLFHPYEVPRYRQETMNATQFFLFVQDADWAPHSANKVLTNWDNTGCVCAKYTTTRENEEISWWSCCLGARRSPDQDLKMRLCLKFCIWELKHWFKVTIVQMRPRPKRIVACKTPKFHWNKPFKCLNNFLNCNHFKIMLISIKF